MKRITIFIGLKIAEVLGIIIFYCLTCLISRLILNYWFFPEDPIVWYHPVYCALTLSFSAVCFLICLLSRWFFELWIDLNWEWTHKIYYKYFAKEKLK